MKFAANWRPSTTGRLLEYNSYATSSHKINVVNSLINRVLKISNEVEIRSGMRYIKWNLKMNGFSKKTVEKQISKLKRKHSAGNHGQGSQNDE